MTTLLAATAIAGAAFTTAPAAEAKPGYRDAQYAGYNGRYRGSRRGAGNAAAAAAAVGIAGALIGGAIAAQQRPRYDYYDRGYGYYDRGYGPAYGYGYYD